MNKTCTTCTTAKPHSAFPKRKSNPDGLGGVCKDCANVSIRRHYHQNKGQYQEKIKRRREASHLFIEEYKKGKRCLYCGEDDPVCFDFHHVDAEDKSFTIAYGVMQGFSAKRLMGEIEKCLLLCSNCHRKLHAGRVMPCLEVPEYCDTVPS